MRRPQRMRSEVDVDGSEAARTTDPRKIELTISSHAKSLPVVRGAVARMAETEGFSEADAHSVALAMDEALANVIKHGYEGQPDMPIHITLEPVHAPDGRPGMQIIVRDHGKQVDPTSIRGRDLDDVRPGGLGVHIMRTVMDEVDFSCPPDGGMLLRMVKYAVRDGNAPRGSKDGQS